MGMTLLSVGFSGTRVYDSVARILASNPLCSMATLGEKEAVHINTAFFCFSDDLDLYFLSDPGSAHCQNIRRSPRMAIAVFDSHQVWGSPHQGLQLFGSCVSAKGKAEALARELYTRRFPLFAKFADRPSVADRAGSSFLLLRFYAFVPTAVKILDEEEFGDEVFVTAEVVR